MNPPLSNVLLVSLALMLSAGCIPLGPRHGQERVVATRTPTTGQVSETIIAVPTEHHWMLLVAPDGPELDYVLSETWRYYLMGPSGSRSPLRFLKHRGFRPWDRLEPIPDEDLWIAERDTSSWSRLEENHHDYRVICFDAKGARTDKPLDFAESGSLEFDQETHTFAYRSKNVTWTYDPLHDSGPHRQP
jgi:hypothetical protein